MYLPGRNHWNQELRFSMRLMQKRSILRREPWIDIATKLRSPTGGRQIYEGACRFYQCSKRRCDADVSVRTELLKKTSLLLKETKDAHTKLIEIEGQAVAMEKAPVRRISITAM